MHITPFIVGGFQGYRFEDVKGRGCSVHQCAKGVTVGMNVSGGNLRMLLDKDEALWLAQILLEYVETGRI